MAKAAFAVAPEDDWWWNPAQPGFGYNIETQNGTVFVAAFIYDDNGSPTWYSGSGSIQNNSVAIDLKRSKDGPCLDCSYTPPQTNSIGKQLVLTFDVSGSTATATLGGITNQIQRFNFKLGSGVNQLLGIWAIANLPQQSNIGLGTSDVILCEYINDQGGANCKGGASGAAGVILPTQDGNYYGLIPISGTKDIAYYFRFNGLNNIGGLSAIVDAGASDEEINNALNNNAFTMSGYRYKN